VPNQALHGDSHTADFAVGEALTYGDYCHYYMQALTRLYESGGPQGIAARKSSQPDHSGRPSPSQCTSGLPARWT
jgi:hypothetical protein